MSDARRFRRIEELFAGARERGTHERARWLAQECGDDVELQREVDALLAASDGAPRFLETPADPRLGRVIGRWRLVERLGSGGMGVVYAAERSDGAYEQRAALKILRSSLDSAEAIARFHHERQLLAELSHPGIARLLDGGTTEDGTPYLVMELVSGSSLDEWCDARRLPIDERLELFLSACAIVHYAHQNLVVHRDLKPSNLFVTDRREIKLLDFGIAKVLHPAAASLRTTTVERRMTPAYASPELVLGGPITTASDVYSLGVVLYESLAGASPYTAPTDTPSAIEKAICETLPPLPSSARISDEAAAARGATVSELRRRLAGDLDAIVMKAMAKEPERRYASAERLAEDLRRFLAHEPIEARGTSSWYLLRKLLARHRLAAALSAAAFLVVLTLSIVASVFWRRAEQTAVAKDAQARRARTFSDFVRQVLEANRLGQVQGRVVTLREMLDQSVEHLTQRPLTDPEVEAELRTSLADAYLSLDLPDDAQPHLARAMELERRLFGARSQSCAHLLTLTGIAADKRGSFRRARELLEEARALEEQLALPEDEDTILTRLALAEAQFNMGDHESAERMLLAAEQAANGSRSALRVLPSGLADFGDVLNSIGEYGRAEEKLRKAISLWRNSGELHRRSASSLRSLARALEGQGRHEEALRTLAEARGQYARISGEDSNDVTLCLVDEARVRLCSGGGGPAPPLFAQLLDRAKGFSKRPSLNSANGLNELGLLASELGDFATAERLLREALALYVGFEGADPSSVATVKGNLADVLDRRGATALAEALCREALREEEPRGPSRDQAKLLHQLAWTLCRRGALDEAESCAARSVSMARERFGEESEPLSDSLTTLGWVRCSRQEWPMAEDALNEALEIRRLRLGDENARTATTLQFLGWTLLCQDKREEAEPLLEEALATRRKVLEAGHPDLVWTLNALGVLRQRQGRNREAVELLREAVERSRDLTADRTELLPISLANLASALRRDGQPDAAEPLLRERFEFLRDVLGVDAEATKAARRALDELRREIGKEPGAGGSDR